MKISIIGSGSWGTALGNVLAINKQNVIVWGRNPQEVNDINQQHHNDAYFKDIELNHLLNATTDYSEIIDADVFLIAVPSIAIEEVCRNLNSYLTKPIIIINVAKGFHPVTHESLSDVIKRLINPEYLTAVVNLIGPSHAEEVVLNQLTTINAVSESDEANRIVQTLFSNNFFRVYRNTDVVGSQIGVAIKNVMALASGVVAGLGYGDNTRAALVTRGLAEMTRYGMHFGGELETFLGLCGVGDLVVTATSSHSRNYQAGYDVGFHNSVKHFYENNTKTVEGVIAAKIVYEIALEEKIDMPITQQVYEIFYEDKVPQVAIVELMNRDLKSE